MSEIISVNGVPVRLPEERWLHITEGHPELAGHYYEVLETVAQPDWVFEGDKEALLAVRKIQANKYLVVVYKETGLNDGFIITAFLTKKIKRLKKRHKIWPQ
ncbi:MAG: hypothetical protein D6681_12550 [Calditrichaeota bacterium]|nr:MAG: hypothetical protein D6681_12550 [Calditrichota bacterium]